jgi:lysozyme
MLIRHEGLRLKPYRDAKNKLTIGVGRNVDDAGITREEALMLLNNDIATVRREIERAFPWVSRLNPVRKNVIMRKTLRPSGYLFLAERRRTVS